MAQVAIPNLNINGVAVVQGAQQYRGWGRRANTDLRSLHRAVAHGVEDAADDEVIVEAEFNAQSSNQGVYNVKLTALRQNGLLISSSCSCPIGESGHCKHACRLIELAITQHIPVNPVYLQRSRKRRRQQDLIAQGVSCYIALASKSELDSGSDWNYARSVKDNYDQKILGIFFSRRAANKRAKEMAAELGWEDDEDEDENEDGDEDEDGNGEDDELFIWSNEEDPDLDEQFFEKVWVEERPIEDASAQFHK